IPNSQMVNDRIVNHSYPEASRRPLLRFDVAEDSDPPAVKRAITEALESIQLVERRPAPSVVFTGFGEGSLAGAVRFTVASHRDDVEAVDAVIQTISRRFREEGIAFPNPARFHPVPRGGGARGSPDERSA